MLAVEGIPLGVLQASCHIVSAPSGDAVIVDPGGEFERIDERVRARDLKVRAILATHAHADHIGAAAQAVEAYDAPFHLHPDDTDLLRRANFYLAVVHNEEPVPIPEIDVALADGMTLRFGAFELAVNHTPGHSPGGVCFGAGSLLFSGDTIMDGAPGRWDLPGGDREALGESVDLLFERYPAETTLHQGHGDPVQLGDVRREPAAAGR